MKGGQGMDDYDDGFQDDFDSSSDDDFEEY